MLSTSLLPASIMLYVCLTFPSIQRQCPTPVIKKIRLGKLESPVTNELSLQPISINSKWFFSL